MGRQASGQPSQRPLNIALQSTQPKPAEIEHKREIIQRSGPEKEKNGEVRMKSHLMCANLCLMHFGEEG